MLILLIHLLALPLGFLVAGQGLAGVRGRIPGLQRWTGGAGWGVLLGWPLVWGFLLSVGLAGRPLLPAWREHLATSLGYGTEQRLGAAVALLLLLGTLWGGFLILRDVLQLRSLRTASRRIEDRVREGEAWKGMGQLRDALQEQFRAETGLGRLEVRICSQVRTPCSVGVFRPAIYAPLWMFEPRSAHALRLLLWREREAVRLGHTRQSTLLWMLGLLLPFSARITQGLKARLDALGDRSFAEGLSGEDREAFLGALRDVLAMGMVGDLPGPLSQAPGRAWDRLRALESPVTGDFRRILRPLLLLGTLAMGMAALGPVRPQALRMFHTRELGQGIAFQDPVGGARAALLPGMGGELSHGVFVDNRRAERGSCLVDCAFWNKRRDLGLDPGVHHVGIHLEVEAVASPGVLQNPLLFVGSYTRNLDETGQMRQVQRLMARVRDIPQGRTTLDLVIPVRPACPSGSSAVVYGPMLHVPRGWRVRVTAFRGRRADAWECHPEGVVQSFETLDAWLAKAGQAPYPNLDWSRD